MSFWGKIKQWMGIGGAKIELIVSPKIEKSSGVINGQLKVTSKSDQQIKKIEIKVIEKWSTGRGEERREREFDLGQTVLDNAFTIKANETKSIDFSVPFNLLKSENDNLKDKGGVVGALGSLGSFMDSEKSEYFIKASADVAGTAFGPNDSKSIAMQ